MQLGMIGLGRMVANMVRRQMIGGHHRVVFDLEPASVKTLADEGAQCEPPLAPTQSPYRTVKHRQLPAAVPEHS